MSITKILVNELPTISYDCPFHRHTGLDEHICNISDDTCSLCYGNDHSCSYLMSYAEYDREQTNKYIQTLDGRSVMRYRKGNQNEEDT